MYIYALVDPRSNEPFYIGSTSLSIKERLKEHICSAKGYIKTVRARQHTILKNDLIKEILNESLCVMAVILYKCEDKDAVKFETFFHNILIEGKILLHQTNGISR